MRIQHLPPAHRLPPRDVALQTAPDGLLLRGLGVVLRGQQLGAAELRLVRRLLGRGEVGGEGGAEVRELGGAARGVRGWGVGGERVGGERVRGGVVGLVRGMVGGWLGLQERAPLREGHVVVFEGAGAVDGEGGGVGGRGREAGRGSGVGEVFVAEHGAPLAEESGGGGGGGDVAGGEAGFDAFRDGGRDDRAGRAAEVAGFEHGERAGPSGAVALLGGVAREGPDGFAGEGGFAGVGAQGLRGHVFGEEVAGDVGGGARGARQGLFG